MFVAYIESGVLTAFVGHRQRRARRKKEKERRDDSVNGVFLQPFPPRRD